MKRIEVRPGQRLSYQKHSRRAEHWLVVAGRALVERDGVESELATGHTIDIPVGAAHRVANTESDVLVLIEIQTGEHFGEGDIVRLADDGRAD